MLPDCGPHVAQDHGYCQAGTQGGLHLQIVPHGGPTPQIWWGLCPTGAGKTKTVKVGTILLPSVSNGSLCKGEGSKSAYKHRKLRVHVQATRYILFV